MARPRQIELEDGSVFPILHEDRSTLAIDKPPGWLVAPDDWEDTARNLQLALTSSIQSGAFWATSRGLKFLRHVHRLDRETSGILLFARSAGAVGPISRLFESRTIIKRYLAVAHGAPKSSEWVVDLPIGPDPERRGRMRGDRAHGKPAVSRFTVLIRAGAFTLVEACPESGRTHQIRLHLAHSGHPIVGDALYGKADRLPRGHPFPLALRATGLDYRDPFTRKQVRIRAPVEAFLNSHGLQSSDRRQETG